MEIRPLRWPDEIALWAALGNAVNPDEPQTAAELEGRQGTVVESCTFLAFDGADAVGYGHAGRDGDPVPYARIEVLPTHRRRGIGSALLAELTGWAGARGYRELEAYVREVHPAGLEFATHRGFVEIGRDFKVELDLTAVEAPAVELPDGIEIVTLAERPELARALYDVYCETVTDVPGEEDYELEPLETWLAADLGAPHSRPEATFVALTGDGEAVGSAQFAFSEAQPTTARHGLTGVKRSWRGRGIAGALKATQIRWAKEHGFERLVTFNEERNAPIRRLNECFGYQPVPGQVMVRGPVARPEQVPS